VENFGICKSGRPGMSWLRLLGFAPVCGPFLRCTFDRRTILPWALPLAGLSGANLRIRAGTTPRFGSPVPEAPLAYYRNLRSRPGRASIRSWVFGEPSRSEMLTAFEAASTVATSCLRSLLSPRRRPFSVLMRLMPGRSGQLAIPIGSAPCLRFCTVRERDVFSS
jgi:hypothetical protein